MSSARVVRPSQRSIATAQTPGMTREEAFAIPGMWAGVAHHDPHAFSGWHHHAAYESAIYVLKGRVRVECGVAGETVLDAGPGDYIYLPAWEVHREGNDSDEVNEVLLVRAGVGEINVNVDAPATRGAADRSSETERIERDVGR